MNTPLYFDRHTDLEQTELNLLRNAIKKKFSDGLQIIKHAQNFKNLNIFVYLPNLDSKTVLQMTKKVVQYGGKIKTSIDGETNAVVVSDNILEMTEEGLKKPTPEINMPYEMTTRGDPMKFAANKQRARKMLKSAQSTVPENVEK
jgi:hypothetical protein